MIEKRILLIGHSGDMYGASRSLAKLTLILSKKYFVYVLLPEKGILYDKLTEIIGQEQVLINDDLYIFTRKSFKLNYFPGTTYQFLRNVRFLRQLIIKYRIDLVHTNSGVVPAGALAAKLMGKKHLWHIREWFGDFKKFWPLYSGYMTKFSDRIICVSKTMASQFGNQEKVVSVYNGFNIPELREKTVFATNLTDAIADADLVLGCTSRIRLGRKGQEYLIEAISIATKHTATNIHLILIGDYVPGYEHEKLVVEKLIDDCNLNGKVHFLGHLTDPLPYYSLFDVFVLPSGEPEPFGGVVMEAMSMGLPIIGSNLGGTTEQIKDEWNGYLFENRNSKDLADKIELFLEAPQKLAEFGTRSNQRVKDLFSLQLHEKQILDIYETVFNEG